MCSLLSLVFKSTKFVELLLNVADAEFRNTGLERSGNLEKDLEWFKQQGHVIPEPSSPGTNYARYLEELSESDPQAFICHFYNTYFAHTAGGRMIGRKVSFVSYFSLTKNCMLFHCLLVLLQGKKEDTPSIPELSSHAKRHVY